jgi:hypothetical protein
MPLAVLWQSNLGIQQRATRSRTTFPHVPGSGDEGTRTLNPRRAKRDPPYRPLPTSAVLRMYVQFSCYLMRLAVNECQRFRSLSAPSALLGVTAFLLLSNPSPSCRGPATERPD